MLEERGELDIAYRADSDRMQPVFHMLHRLKENDILDVIMVKFLISSEGGARVTVETDESFADILRMQLTSKDVISKGGQGIYMAFLIDRSQEEADEAAEETIRKWKANPENEKFTVTFEKEML